MPTSSKDPGTWQKIVLARVDLLRAEEAAVEVEDHFCGADTAVVRQKVKDNLGKAEQAARARGPHRLRSWWQGARIESAWRHIHAAEVLLAELFPIETLNGRRADVLELVVQSFPRGDHRVQAATAGLSDERWLTRGAGHVVDAAHDCALRAQYAAALRWGYDATDNQHQRVRSFRNTLLTSTVAMALLVAVLAGVGMRWPDALALCGAPPPAAATGEAVRAAEPLSSTCPTGRTGASGGDVLVVELVGVLGAALAAAVALRRAPGNSTPYQLSPVTSLFKVPSGALMAVAGLLLLRSGLVSGVVSPSGQAELLGWALLFGFSQELFTHLADTKADEVISKVPTVEPGDTSG